MKNYRKLVPIVMIVLVLTSWYMLISGAVKTTVSYNNYLVEARKQAELGITKYAIENYEEALKIKSSPDIYEEVSKYYVSQDKLTENMNWCMRFMDEYPTNSKAYDCMLAAYVNEKDYESCFDILETAEKRNVKSDYIKKTSEELAYVYSLDFNNYDAVGMYSNNFCPVKSKEVWGFVDRLGNQKIACKYKQVGGYTQSGVASVVNVNDEAYFIDKTGSKVMVSKEKFLSFGLLVDNMIAAQKSSKKYTYVNQNFETLFGEYDYASTFNNGIAAVKVGNQWSIINDKGKETTDSKYLDIILDQKQIPYRSNRLFVSNVENEYYMIDDSGKQVGKNKFENAKVFLSDDPTAVKINGMWKFIKSDGNFLSDNQYEDARPFSNGLAAVKIDGKWGFVDLKENLVIKNEFFDASDFNDKGSCFVKTGDKWQLLKLYRLNREN